MTEVTPEQRKKIEAFLKDPEALRQAARAYADFVVQDAIAKA